MAKRKKRGNYAERKNKDGSISRFSIPTVRGKPKWVKIPNQPKYIGKRGAKRHLEECRHDLSGDWTSDNFDSAAKRFLGRIEHGKKSTYITCESVIRCHLSPYFGSMPITSIRRRDVQAFIDFKIAEGINPNFLRLNIIGSLSSVLSRYVGEELLARNPASGQPAFIFPKAEGAAARKKGRALTPAEIEALLQNSPPQFWPIFVWMMHSAMRIGETLAMTWDNLHIVNDASGQAIIRYKVAHTLEPKTYKLVSVKTEASNADIYLPASIVPVIEEQRRKIAEARLSNTTWIDEGLVWPRMPKLYDNTNGAEAFARFGSALRPNLVRNVLAQSALRANIGIVRPHDLRHTCASLLISEDVNIKIVSGHLRHAKTSTTWDIYGHMYPDDQAQAAHKLGLIFNTPISAKIG